MHSQTLRELVFGVKATRASNPDKNWSLSTLQTICRLVHLWRVVQVAVGQSLCCCSWWTF